MKKITFLLILSLFISCGPNTRMVYDGRGEYTYKSDQVIIPYETKLDLIIVPYEIRGHEFNLIMDTGANTTISSEVVEKTELTTKQFSKIRDSQGQVRMTNYAEVDLMKNEFQEYKNLNVLTSPFDADLFKYAKASGLMGNEQLRKSNWKIDPTKNELTAFDLNAPLSDIQDYSKIDFVLDHQNRPFIKAKIGDNEPINILIDLGSNEGLTLNAKHIEKLKDNALSLYCDVIGYRTGLHGASKSKKTYYKADKVTLGKFASNHDVILVTQANTRSKIGMDFFKKYYTYFDFKENALYLKPISDLWIANEVASFSVILSDTEIQVGRSNECNENNNLPVGTKVLKINDLDCSNADFKTFCKALDIITENDQITVEAEINNKKEVFNNLQTKWYLGKDF